jgi:hypothetical protein
MNREEVIKMFERTIFKFHSYYKYEFIFKAEIGDYVMYGIIGDGTADRIYKFEISNDMEKYLYNCDMFQLFKNDVFIIEGEIND